MSEPTKYTAKLKGARVLVIGGSSGIGFGVVEALIENGASVIVSSSSQDKIDKTISRIKSSYPSAEGRITGHACNLGKADTMDSEVSNLFDQVAKGGKLDHVVHTAGDPLPIGKLEEITMEKLQQAGMVRFFAPIIVAKHLRKHLKDGPAASFTLTTGSASEKPPKDWAVIIGYLKGLEGTCRSLAVELKPIRVNLVNPGAVDTELWDAFKKAGNFEKMKQSFESQMLTGKVGTVEDVAETYLYCMKNHNITGSMIITNGGSLLL